MAEQPLPSGIALTALDPEYRRDPYPLLKRLHAQAPVHEDTELKRFIVSSHDEVKAILRDADYWSDPRKANPGTFSYEVLGASIPADEEPSMLLMDEPGHRRLRSLVSQSFTPRAVERWRPRTSEVVDRVLADLPTGEFDLIRDFAGPIPTIVIAELLGIESTHHAQFKAWSDEGVPAAFNPFPTPEQIEVRDAAMESLYRFFQAEITRRRSALGDDLISDMLRAEIDGERLSEAEIIRQAILLLIAGNVTTTDLIGNGVKALLDHPAQWAALREDPSLIERAVEEMLRYDSPVVNSGRIPNRDVVIGGCPVAKGESLSTSLAAANRDPSVYANPDAFDIRREDVHHQSFGGGRHLCLGAHLARLEAQIAISSLIAQYPNLRHSDKGFEYHAIPSFRGMSEFWVKP